MEDQKQFYELLKNIQNVEVTVNVYLVLQGVRKATLMEYSGIQKGKKEGDRITRIIRKLPLKTKWESEGKQPRLLIVNKKLILQKSIKH